MKDSLIIAMYKIEKISLKQLQEISRILCKVKLHNKEFIANKYNKSAPYFNNTIDFMRALKLIAEKGNTIEPLKSYKAFLKEYEESNFNIETLRKYIIGAFVLKINVLSKYVKDYLSNFVLVEGKYIFRASTSQRIKYSGIRNILLELELIRKDEQDAYYISEEYSSIINKRRGNRRLSQDAFEDIMRMKAQLGRKAELEIIKYEIDKLEAFPYLIEQIEHTSTLDVKAGYDIKSYKNKLSKDNKPLPMYIEVKAVSSLSYEFYWTNNEIETAKILGEDYYLYLLPVRKGNIFDIGKMLIVRNPYKCVYQNRLQWECFPEIISCSLKKPIPYGPES